MNPKTPAVISISSSSARNIAYCNSNAKLIIKENPCKIPEKKLTSSHYSVVFCSSRPSFQPPYDRSLSFEELSSPPKKAESL